MTTIRQISLNGSLPSLIDRALTKYRLEGRAAENLLADEQLSTELQIIHDDGTPDGQYRYFGPGHMTIEFFGWQFAKNAVGQRGIPDRTFNASLRQRYYEVSCTQQPAVDRIFGKVNGVRGTGYVEYLRAILPGEMAEQLPVFSVFLQLQRKLDVPDLACTPDLPEDHI